MSTEKMSITTEMDAVRSRMNTDIEGLLAFRHGQAIVTPIAESADLTSTTIVDDITQALTDETAMHTAESLRQSRPDEFALGAALHAYLIRKARREA